MKGSINPTVVPAPATASAATSFPLNNRGMSFSWKGVNDVKSRLAETLEQFVVGWYFDGVHLFFSRIVE